MISYDTTPNIMYVLFVYAIISAIDDCIVTPETILDLCKLLELLEVTVFGQSG